MWNSMYETENKKLLAKHSNLILFWQGCAVALPYLQTKVC